MQQGGPGEGEAQEVGAVVAVDVEAELRVVFYVESDLVVTVDIGSHDIYRG